jgi:hypothetical protein
MAGKMEEEKNGIKYIFIRIAWFDRENKKYDFGAWKDISKEDISSIVEWVKIQNKKYPHVKYWIEALDGENLGEVKNIEFYDLISVEKDDGSVECSGWLSINHS